MDEKIISRNQPFINERKIVSTGFFSNLFRSRAAPQNSTNGSGYRFLFGGSTNLR
jgi:hypothetical protein